MKNSYVFVYGTLRSNLSNHYLLKDANVISKQCWTSGMLYDVGYGYPAMALNYESNVYGELYLVSEKELEQLDWLEGYKENRINNHYERILQTVYTDKGISYEAYVYVYGDNQVTDLQRIEYGDWKYYLSLRKKSLCYFAYGSCMDDRRFIKQKVAHLFQDIVDSGILPNYQLAFTRKADDGGRADIIEGIGEVEGKIYRVNQEAVSYLEKREGVLYGTYRPTFVDVKTSKTVFKDVLTYVVINKEEETAPPIKYAAEILRGSACCLSEKYRMKLLRDLEVKFGLNFDDIFAEMKK